MWFELHANVIIATVIFCWWFLSRCGCQTLVSLQCTKLYFFMLEVGFWRTLHYHDVELNAAFQSVLWHLCGPCCWVMLAVSRWMGAHQWSRKQCQLLPVRSLQLLPTATTRCKWFSVSYKGSYGLSSVNKNNFNPTLCSKVLVFLKPFSVNLSWRMLNVADSYVNTCIIKCNPIHCISLSLSFPPSLSHALWLKNAGCHRDSFALWKWEKI